MKLFCKTGPGTLEHKRLDPKVIWLKYVTAHVCAVCGDLSSPISDKVVD